MSIIEMREMYKALIQKEETEGLTKCEKETVDAVWTAIDAYEMQAIEDLF